MGELVDCARELVAARMAVVLPQRFAHVQAVAAKAGNLRPILDGDADLLVTAAWLHDIGYAPTVEDTGFHPLDGARYLRGLGADSRLWVWSPIIRARDMRRTCAAWATSWRSSQMSTRWCVTACGTAT